MQYLFLDDVAFTLANYNYTINHTKNEFGLTKCCIGDIIRQRNNNL